jgi:REP element-mobilizing transposase RayT
VWLKGHDYTRGIYFVTISAKNRECLFGTIENTKVKLNEYGKIIKEEWLQTQHMRSNIKLGEFVIMPNHFHAIIQLKPSLLSRGTMHCAPTEDAEFSHIVKQSLGAIMRGFKSSVTERIRKLPGGYEGHFWQRNYYEHLIRSSNELEQIRTYISENPQKWDRDRENIT